MGFHEKISFQAGMCYLRRQNLKTESKSKESSREALFSDVEESSNYVLGFAKTLTNEEKKKERKKSSSRRAKHSRVLKEERQKEKRNHNME